jgi:hypothetical protein
MVLVALLGPSATFCREGLAFYLLHGGEVHCPDRFPHRRCLLATGTATAQPLFSFWCLAWRSDSTLLPNERRGFPKTNQGGTFWHKNAGGSSLFVFASRCLGVYRLGERKTPLTKCYQKNGALPTRGDATKCLSQGLLAGRGPARAPRLSTAYCNSLFEGLF